MAQHRTMQLSILNIKIHPHTPDLYHQMFKTAFSHRLVSKIRGVDSGMIGSFREDQFEEKGVLFGYIFKFLNINPHEKWLNLSNFETIDPLETGELPVPETLKPNLRQIGYVFYPERHRLLFDSTLITPGSALNFFKRLFGDQSIVSQFGPVDINIEATHEAIARILSIPQIKKLVIKFTRPNNDDTAGLEGAIQARIEGQNIKRFQQEASTDDAEGIVPDEETKALMNIARSNGSVFAMGYDGDEKIEHSTIDHPIKERMLYYPDLENKTQTMINFSISLIKKFFG